MSVCALLKYHIILIVSLKFEIEESKKIGRFYLVTYSIVVSGVLSSPIVVKTSVDQYIHLMYLCWRF